MGARGGSLQALGGRRGREGPLQAPEGSGQSLGKGDGRGERQSFKMLQKLVEEFCSPNGFCCLLSAGYWRQCAQVAGG